MDAKDRIIEQRMAKRRRNALIIKSLIAFMLLAVIVMLVVLIRAGIRDSAFDTVILQLQDTLGIEHEAVKDEQVIVEQTEDETQAEKSAALKALIAQAEHLAAQYDYQPAIDLLKGQTDFNTNTQLQNLAGEFQSKKDGCRAYPVDEIPHVFFHTLIKDTALAFDGDEDTAGYNQVMTTISEFNSIIEQMYEKGYVMVSLHDMCEVRADGTVGKKEIRLPEGKTPFVLSQDDVSYYHYMKGDGFADQLVLDDQGKVKNSYIEADGSVSIGDYDMVPLIDSFVEKHPDFSYHGHKGIIALTGYEGVLGYRTDEVYQTRQEDRLTKYQRAFLEENPDFDFAREVASATEVATVMKQNGWEFASHTWGHINPLYAGFDRTVTDTERWLANVAPIVGDTDVLIFAFGADIGDWRPYTADNEFFVWLKQQGFSIFCNVDGSQPYWVQFGNDNMRQGRRNLDGYRMYYNPELLSDLFDVEKAWDDSRPVPVPEM